MKRPEARSDGTIWKWIGDEIVLVDEKRQRAHCLNRAAAALWRRCDGKTEIGQLVESLAEELDLEDAGPLVAVGLRQLARARLLTECEQPRKRASQPTSRRQLLKRLGVAALVPQVLSIVVPTPAMAQSMLPNGSPCTASSQCASGCCHASLMTCKPGGGHCL